ncbi:MAG TPA: SMI1/KNR4 family protein [Verrucomicrobiae bacterium]
MLREIVEPNSPISESEISVFESRFRLALPHQYRQFLLTNNGGRPVPSAFPILGFSANPRGNIQAFFGLGATIGTEDVALVLSQLVHDVPAGILPVACTGCDDFLCLDLRKPSAPVRFWDRRPFWGSNKWSEADLYPVTKDFASLLEALDD